MSDESQYLPSHRIEMSDCYQFTGQAHHATVVDRDAVLVLDTNVLSTIYSVCRGGFRLDRVQDRRAAHLLRWLAARPDVAVWPLFGALEGSGFHRGAVDDLGLIRRCVAAGVFATWGREHAEQWIASGASPPADIGFPSDAVHPDFIVELGEALLPWTVLPGYVAALAMALVDREGKQGLAGVEAVHRLLVTNLDHVPAFGWVVSSLAFIGTPTLRLELRRDLFKLGRREPRTQCLSAGWDIGYLELMSIARTPTVQPLLDGRTPLLVTEDRRLAPVATLLMFQRDTGVFEINDALIDTSLRTDAIELIHKLHDERLLELGDAPMPSWEACAAAARKLEGELGITDAPTLALRSEPQLLEIEPRAVRLWVSALAIEQGNQAVDHLISPAQEGIDMVTSGFTTVAMLLRDDSQAHDREPSTSWQRVLDTLPRDLGNSTSFVLAAKLVLTLAEEDWSLSTALFKKLLLDETDGIVIMWIWYLGRKLLEDIAVSRQCSVGELVRRTQQHVDASSPEEHAQAVVLD